MLGCSGIATGLAGNRLDAEVVKSRLPQGDRLEVSMRGGAFEVWAEPFASPPSVPYDAERFDRKESDSVIERIPARLAERDERWHCVED